MKHPLQVSKWKKLITSSRITPSLLTMQALLSDVIVLVGAHIVDVWRYDAEI